MIRTFGSVSLVLYDTIAGWLLGCRPELFAFEVFVECVDDGEAAVDFVHDGVVEVECVVDVAVVDEAVPPLPERLHLLDCFVVDDSAAE